MLRKPLYVGIVILLGTLVGIHMMRLILAGQLFPVLILLAAIAAVAWATMSGDHWWLPALVAMYGGGEVNFSFRIYLMELAIAFVAAVVVIRILVGKTALPESRTVPICLWLLLGYLFLHMTTSLVSAKLLHAEGIGSIARVYLNSMLHLAFAALLLAYGRIPKPRLVMCVIFAVTMSRVLLDILSAFDLPMTIPGLPISIPAALVSTVDLRTVGVMLLPVTLALSNTALTPTKMWTNVLLSAGALAATAYGASRVGLIKGAVIILTYLIFRRRILATAALLAAIAAGVIVINGDPELLYSMPANLRRGLLGTVVPSKFTDVHSTVEGSSRWHVELMHRGFHRWTQNPATFAVGNMVRAPYDRNATDLTFEEGLEKAVQMGAYESGLWTVLSILGTVGALLYFRVMWTLGKPVFIAVWRRGVNTPAMALCFIALTAVVEWVAFCPVAGGFPTQAVVALAVAWVAMRDSDKSQGSMAAKKVQPETTRNPASGAVPGLRRGNVVIP